MDLNINTDGYPAPEQRVREYVEAQAQEDARTGTTTDEIAWAVPDEGRLRALAIGDLRDALAELDAARAVLDRIAVEAEAGLTRSPGGPSHGSAAALVRIQRHIEGSA